MTASRDHFSPGQIWPDNQGVHINAHGGGILGHDDTYYWFGEHKVEGDAGNYAQVGVHVYSSRDLYHWKDEGIALAVEDDPKSDIARGCILERPKVIYNARTGKFVMWFHLELAGQGYQAARSGVAVADQPAGPYRFVESFRPHTGVWPLNAPKELCQPLTSTEREELSTLDRSGGMNEAFPKDLIFRRDFDSGQMARDLTLFVDDDGVAYYIYSSEENGTTQISRLADDYLRPAGRYIRIFPGRFHEAPALMKRDGKYFLFTSGCTGWATNPARLSTAPSIWGPWEELGNPCLGSEAEKGTTFEAQSTYVLPVAGQPDAFIFVADRWCPENAIEGRYVWLPVEFENGQPVLRWHEHWDLGFFDGQTGGPKSAEMEAKTAPSR